MYGMVNGAMESLIVEQHGEAVWDAICRRAGVERLPFVKLQPYSDRITYDLVAAAAAELGAPADDLLEAFGRFWITYAAANGYAHFLGGAGTDLGDYLASLDAMHARLALTMPALRPPGFRVIARAGASVRLAYHSDREGLRPFVVGLIEGLGARFGTPARIALIAPRAHANDPDIFDVSWGAAA